MGSRCVAGRQYRPLLRMQVATETRLVLLDKFVQLDNMFEFRAVFLYLGMITPDHLDRYEFKMHNYVDSRCAHTEPDF